MYIHLFKIPSSDHRQLGCVHVLVTVNNAAVNMGMQISLQDPDFNCFGFITRRRIAGS